MGTVFAINNDQMGYGDRQLGRKLLSTCLKKLGQYRHLDAVVLYNAGVRLATKDSFVATELRLLHEAGVDILACGTCVSHFGLEDQLAVDQISNMDDILTAMRKADKVVTL